MLHRSRHCHIYVVIIEEIAFALQVLTIQGKEATFAKKLSKIK